LHNKLLFFCPTFPPQNHRSARSTVIFIHPHHFPIRPMLSSPLWHLPRFTSLVLHFSLPVGHSFSPCKSVENLSSVVIPFLPCSSPHSLLNFVFLTTLFSPSSHDTFGYPSVDILFVGTPKRIKSHSPHFPPKHLQPKGPLSSPMF